MPVAPDPSFGWQEATVAYVVVLIASFMVTWIVTDLLGVRRAPYIGVLTVVTVALGAGYLSWSGTLATDLLTSDVGWAVVAAIVVGAVVTPGVRRLPGRGRPEGSIAWPFLWEGVVYGSAEALLLATLPVLAVWQAADDLGWIGSTWGEIGSGALAVVGALLVIAIHHLGYREFRAEDARAKLIGALFGCGLQALAFLLTGNVLAPVLAHVLLHWQLTLRGVEMPPVEEAAAPSARPSPSPLGSPA